MTLTYLFQFYKPVSAVFQVVAMLLRRRGARRVRADSPRLSQPRLGPAPWADHGRLPASSSGRGLRPAPRSWADPWGAAGLMRSPRLPGRTPFLGVRSQGNQLRSTRRGSPCKCYEQGFPLPSLSFRLFPGHPGSAGSRRHRGHGTEIPRNLSSPLFHVTRSVTSG